MQTTLPLPVANLKRAFDTLSDEHKAMFEDAIADHRGQSGDEIPAWQLELLEQRERAVASGQSIPVPWSEAKRRIQDRLAGRRDEA